MRESSPTFEQYVMEQPVRLVRHIGSPDTEYLEINGVRVLKIEYNAYNEDDRVYFGRITRFYKDAY